MSTAFFADTEADNEMCLSRKERFTEMGFRDEVLNAIKDNAFENPSEIQERAIPIALSREDLLCQAKSGKGKTAVFVLSILNNINLEKCRQSVRKPQVLVLCITHELAGQIANEFRRFSTHFVAEEAGKEPHQYVNTCTLVGGQTEKSDAEKLAKQDIDIVVGTLGRISSMVEKGVLDLSEIDTFVIDECDNIFTKISRPIVPRKVAAEIKAESQTNAGNADASANGEENATAADTVKSENVATNNAAAPDNAVKAETETEAATSEQQEGTENFTKASGEASETEEDKLAKKIENTQDIERVTKIIAKMKADHQTMMFSATMPEVARKVCERFLKPGYKALIVDKDSDLVIHNLTQYYMNCEENTKLSRYSEIITKVPFAQAIVFVNNDTRARALSIFTQNLGVKSDYISGKRNDRQRANVYNKFKEDAELRVVVSTDIFQRGVDFSRVNLVIHFDAPKDAEAYLHRSGRSGRFETPGVTVGFFDLKEQKDSAVFVDIKSRFTTDIKEVSSIEEDLKNNAIFKRD